MKSPACFCCLCFPRCPKQIPTSSYTGRKPEKQPSAQKLRAYLQPEAWNNLGESCGPGGMRVREIRETMSSQIILQFLPKWSIHQTDVAHHNADYAKWLLYWCATPLQDVRFCQMHSHILTTGMSTRNCSETWATNEVVGLYKAGILAQTICSCIRKANIHVCSPHHRMDLTAARLHNHLIWAKTHVQWPLAHWTTVWMIITSHCLWTKKMQHQIL